MTTLAITTKINAPVQRCFDLSLSIDLHKASTAHTGEDAIAGVTTGLIRLGQSVTWRAKHLGIWQQFTSKITDFNRPDDFVDEMQKGAFSSFWHQHRFEATDDGTLMTDTIRYEVPMGPFGGVFDRLYLKRYMTRLIEIRNEVIKSTAESGQWKVYLKPPENTTASGQ